MLRGWKSASCSGFPARSGVLVGKIIEEAGNRLATSNVPALSSKRLRPIPFMNSPDSGESPAPN
jgi:hypothetical protein